ncbi:MAG: PspC domain-containing protein, partial [Chitinophagaceae bacterium]
AEREQGTGSTFENTSSTAGATTEPTGAYQDSNTGTRQRSLFRSANDKILGGVCSGLGNYFGIDPSIMRLVFVLFLFMGFGFLLYVVLWIVVPAKFQTTSVRKRLYRNPDTKMIGGVSGGIAAYLNIDVWIPRLIFISPFVLGALGRIFRHGWLDFDPVPNFIFNGFGGSLFITYIVLWIVLPQAQTSTEKMEMRGEKVDLESISKTVKEDLENLRGRAERVGGDLKDRAQIVGQQFRSASAQFNAEAGPVIRSSGSGFGRAVGLIFKAFFLFVAGVIVFALTMALIAVLFSGVGAFPFKDFLFDGFWQNLLVWLTLLLFLGVPVIGLLTWLVRRIMNVRSRNNYLGFTFGGLWVIGLISAILLGGSLASNFKSRISVKDDIIVAQPSTDKLWLKVAGDNVKYYGSDWFGFEGEMPFFSKSEDSIMLNTVRLKLIKSNDSSFHISTIKFSNGTSPVIAERLANNISFPIIQKDSLIYLPKGFTITPHEKFRNQQVLLVLEIPIGKKIQIDRNVDNFSHFNVNVGNRRGWNVEWDDRWNNSYYYKSNIEYVMTAGGLEETDKKEKLSDKKTRNQRLEEEKQQQKTDRNSEEEEQAPEPPGNNGYRYQNKKNTGRDSTRKGTPDSATSAYRYHSSKQMIAQASGDSEFSGPLFPLLVVFQ